MIIQEVLEALCKIQSRNPKDIGYDEDIYNGIELHNPTLCNLEEILYELTCGNKDANVKKITSTDFISKLSTIFLECSAEDKKNLESLFNIFKQLCKNYVVHFCSSELIDLLLSDQHFYTVINALENDPGLNGIKFDLKQAYQTSSLNNILDIDNAQFLELITKAHRLQFIRDTALARTLDDAASSYLFMLQQSL